MNRAGLAGLIALGLAGCESVGPPAAPTPPPPPPPTLGSILGEGAFRTLTGVQATCAGQSVALTADTPRSRGRMVALYGSTVHAFEPINLVKARAAALGPANDAAFMGSVTCQSDGRFAFPDLHAGAYFVIARVRLNRPEKGQDEFVVMQAVSLGAGEARQVHFAP